MAQIVRNDVAAVADSADELLKLSNEHGLAQPRAAALAYLGWALGQAKDVDQGVSLLEQGLAAWERLGIRTNLDFYICLLAETYFKGRRYEEAMEKADLAIATSSEIGDRWCLPRIHLVRGQLLQHTSGDPDYAEQSLHLAVEVARSQCAKATELRAAARLARLWLDQGKRVQARELLAPVYDSFTEGYDTHDLEEAKALLVELAS
jgi:predicted ATPase